MQKIKTWLSDHYHLLFKSAADNHLRIQRCTDGSYQCLIRFNSYSELKKYQKRVRRVTVSLSSAVAMVVVAFIVAPYIMNPNRSSASTFLWKQESWTGNGTGSTANYPGSNSGFTDYTSKTNIDVSSGKVTMTTPQVASGGDSTYAGGGGFYRSDAGGTYSASGSTLTLKKVLGATCTDNSECVNNNCDSALLSCSPPCGELTASRMGITYGTVSVAVTGGTQCWLDRDLGAPSIPSSYLDSSAHGWLFQWGRTDDGHRLRTSSISGTRTDSPGSSFIVVASSPYDWRLNRDDTLWQNVNSANNPCPTGFRVPTSDDWNKYLTATGLSSCLSDCYNLLHSSPLKIIPSSTRSAINGTIVGGGQVWASDISSANAKYLGFSGSYIVIGSSGYRATGAAVRCIKN